MTKPSPAQVRAADRLRRARLENLQDGRIVLKRLADIDAGRTKVATLDEALRRRGIDLGPAACS